MSITSSELVWRKPAEVSNAATNGGRMTSTMIPSATKNNLFPNVPHAERVAGVTKYRKAFIHVASDDSLALIAPKVFVSSPTPGDDRVTIFLGTQTDTQAAITGAEPRYGAGTLNASALAGATSIQVLVENAADNIFRNGMQVRISDRQSLEGSGNDQYLLLSEAPTYSGNVATLTFATTPLAVNFSTAGPTYVSGVMATPDVAASVSDFVVTSTLGTYNHAGNPIRLHGVGTIEQLWTLTFTSSTVFTASGDTVGVVGTGNVGTNFIPANPAFSKPFLTLLAAGFGGTFAPGDTIRFRTHPAAIPVWYRQDVPAGANSLAANRVAVAVDGESE